MASIVKLGKGKQPPRAIDFIDKTDDNRRKRIRLGIVSHDFAKTAKTFIERLHTAKRLNRPIDGESEEWLFRIADDLHGKGPEFSAEMMIEFVQQRKQVIEIPVNYFNRSQSLQRAYQHPRTFVRFFNLICRKRLQHLTGQRRVRPSDNQGATSSQRFETES